jgi:hypothetical protein
MMGFQGKAACSRARRAGAVGLVLAISVAVFVPVKSEAQVVGVSDQIEVVTLPPSLLGGIFTSQTHIRLMHEGTGIVTSDMPGFAYDGAYHNPGLPTVPGDSTFGNAITTPYSGPGLPAAGTEVYSILLHFDPNISGLPFSLTQGMAQSGSISFDRPILGVYVTSEALNATDSIFSPGGISYPTSPGRDMEFNYAGDQYSISPDRHELALTMFVHNGGVFDQMRIVLSANPPTPAINVPIDVTNASNGLTGIFSTIFDGALTPCVNGSSTFCTFFDGDPDASRNISQIPDPGGVVNNMPGGIGPGSIPSAPVPASGSFLNLALSNDHSLLTLGVSSVTFGIFDLCIAKSDGCAQINAHAVDAGIVFNPPGPANAGALTPTGGGSTGDTVAVDGNGKAVFQVQNAGAVVADFSQLSQVVTSCTGTSCSLITSGVLNLDIVRYVLEIDYDPTFTTFTGHLIGQTGNNTMIYARLNSVGADDDADGIVDTQDNCPQDPNPYQTDTDGDGAGDACDSDSDGDGLSDGEEVNLYATDPLNPDSDGDHLGDGEEVNVYNSDPNHNDTGDLAPRDNPDGTLNAGDLAVLMRLVLELETPTVREAKLADMNHDGLLNAADILLLTAALGL